MSVALPIENMSVSDKLAAIEQLWDDLAKEPGNVPSPDWHGAVLHARSEKVADGEAAFSTLEDAKARLRKQG